MALPKLTTTRFSVELPSTKEKIEFRPFLVKEEKALLVAMESGEENDMVAAMRDIVNNCVETPGFDVSKIPFFDAEYLFLNLRAKSVGEVSTLEYRHTDGVNYKGEPCEVATEVKVNLEDVKVEGAGEVNDKIQITDKLSVKLRYPSIIDISKYSLSEGSSEINLLASAIEYAFDESEIYEADTEEEKIEFIESMNTAQIQKMSEFFNDMPRIKHSITYKCEGCGQEDTVNLEGLADFF